MDSVFAGFVWLLFFLLALAGLVFWIWSLVDCLKAEWKNSSDKTVWLLVILFLSLFGSMLYVLIGKDKQVKKGETSEQVK